MELEEFTPDSSATPVIGLFGGGETNRLPINHSQTTLNSNFEIQNFSYISQSWYHRAFNVLISNNKENLNGLVKDMLDGQILIVGNFGKPTPGEHSEPKLFESEVFINQYYKNTDEVFQHNVANEISKGLTSNCIKIWNELGGKFPGEKKIHTELIFLYGEKGRSLLRSAEENGYITFIYSKLLPCAGISGNINDCSLSLVQVLQTHNKTKPLKPLRFVVGYENIFDETVPSQALSSLRKAHIPVIKWPYKPETCMWDPHFDTQSSLEVFDRKLSILLSRVKCLPRTHEPINQISIDKTAYPFVEKLYNYQRQLDKQVLRILHMLTNPPTENITYIQKYLQLKFNKVKLYIQKYIQKILNMKLLSDNKRLNFEKILTTQLKKCSEFLGHVTVALNSSYRYSAFLAYQGILEAASVMFGNSIQNMIETLRCMCIQLVILLLERQLNRVKHFLKDGKTGNHQHLYSIFQKISDDLYMIVLYKIFSVPGKQKNQSVACSPANLTYDPQEQDEKFKTAKFKNRYSLNFDLNLYYLRRMTGLYESLQAQQLMQTTMVVPAPFN